jgi:thiazole synthase
MDPLIIAGRQFRSRLIVGTGKYKSGQETARAIEASGAEMVTVAVRRVNLDRRLLHGGGSHSRRAPGPRGRAL